MRRALLLAALGFALVGCDSSPIPEGMPAKNEYKSINPQEILGSTKDAYKKAKAAPKPAPEPAPAPAPAK